MSILKDYLTSIIRNHSSVNMRLNVNPNLFHIQKIFELVIIGCNYVPSQGQKFNSFKTKN